MSLTATIIYDELVERCKQGDVKGYEELYHRYCKAMYNTSLRIVNSTADAEDVLQESFLSAFSHLHDFDYSSTFGAWFKRIVINKSISHLRKKKMALVDLEETSVNEYAEPARAEEENIDLKVVEIKKAMALLPHGYRTVLSMVLFEKYSYSEISAALDISEITVRTQYHRARQKLLQLLKTEVRNERQTATIH